jgi:hypothetical protein
MGILLGTLGEEDQRVLFVGPFPWEVHILRQVSLAVLYLYLRLVDLFTQHRSELVSFA